MGVAPAGSGRWRPCGAETQVFIHARGAGAVAPSSQTLALSGQRGRNGPLGTGCNCNRQQAAAGRPQPTGLGLERPLAATGLGLERGPRLRLVERFSLAKKRKKKD